MPSEGTAAGRIAIPLILYGGALGVTRQGKTFHDQWHEMVMLPVYIPPLDRMNHGTPRTVSGGVARDGLVSPTVPAQT